MCVEEFLRKLSAYIAEHPPVLHSEDADTILDALFWVYSEAACADGQAVRQYIAEWLQHQPERRLHTQRLLHESHRAGYIFSYLLR